MAYGYAAVTGNLGVCCGTVGPLTAADYKIPVIWVILKNNRLGAIHDVQELSYPGRISASMFTDIDFVAIAKAFGAYGFRIEKPEDIVPTVKNALDINGPVILEAIIDPD